MRTGVLRRLISCALLLLPAAANTPSPVRGAIHVYSALAGKFAFVQPDLQWVINPGGTNRIPNALVLGAQMGVTF